MTEEYAILHLMGAIKFHANCVFIILALFFDTSFAAESKKAQSIPKECRAFFENAKLVKGKNCSIDCALIKSDMGTFDCGRFCDLFCSAAKNPEPSNYGLKLSSLYPGLTKAEKQFIDRNEKVAIHAYWLSWRAESICKEIYFNSDTNDESDACRHFIWAALLNAEYGPKLASELLDAHEQNPNQPEDEKSMDLANNRRGLIASAELIENDKNSDAAFLKQFLNDLKDGKIVVLSRRVK